MNGFMHPGHWAAIQHFDGLRTAEQYEIDRAMRMADEQRRAQRKARRADGRAQRRRLIRGSIRFAFGSSN